jgi:hypothetical protein
MAIVMSSEARDCDELEKVVSNWPKSIAECETWPDCGRYFANREPDRRNRRRVVKGQSRRSPARSPQDGK